MYKNLIYVIYQWFNGHSVPEERGRAYISSIHKKGNKKDSNNYGGISVSVTSTINRLYGRIIWDLIEKDYTQPEEEEQSGFRAVKSCIDNVFCPKKRFVKNMETHITFVDLQKTYDTILSFKLLKTLENSRILVTSLKEL